jgi:DNA-binding transcriptional regulator/RsmH inhibitor MraZ
MFLVGAHDLTLDVPKKRLSIPSAVRSEMQRILTERARLQSAASSSEPGRAVEGPTAAADRAGRKTAGQDDEAGGAFYLKPGDRVGVLELYESEYFEEIRRLSIPMERLPREVRDLRIAESSMTYRVECDAQGRIQIPDRLADFAQFGKDVTLVGAVDHYKLMSRAKYEQMIAAQMFSWEQKYDQMTSLPRNGESQPGSPACGSA